MLKLRMLQRPCGGAVLCYGGDSLLSSLSCVCLLILAGQEATSQLLHLTFPSLRSLPSGEDYRQPVPSHRSTTNLQPLSCASVGRQPDVAASLQIGCFVSSFMRLTNSLSAVFPPPPPFISQHTSLLSPSSSILPPFTSQPLCSITFYLFLFYPPVRSTRQTSFSLLTLTTVSFIHLFVADPPPSVSSNLFVWCVSTACYFLGATLLRHSYTNTSVS